MIRAAHEQDLAAILDIYNDAILHTTSVYHYKAHSLEERMAWFRQKQEQGFPVLVFEKDGAVAGFATFGPFRPWPAYKYTVEHSVYVDKAFRRMGVGSALLEAVIHAAEEREYAAMVAGIDSANAVSIRLHEQFGFRRAGTIRKAGFKFGRWLDLVFYEKELEGPRNPVDG